MADPFNNAEAAMSFIRAGNARVTLLSEKTGLRYTYRVRLSQEDAPTDPRRRFFVELLKGRDNNGDFSYIGMIRDRSFFTTRATHHLKQAAFVKAFDYVYKHLCAGHMPPHAQVWHESRCGRCGRPLTVPSSIASGIGPECSKMAGVGI